MSLTMVRLVTRKAYLIIVPKCAGIWDSAIQVTVSIFTPSVLQVPTYSGRIVTHACLLYGISSYVGLEINTIDLKLK